MLSWGGGRLLFSLLSGAEWYLAIWWLCSTSHFTHHHHMQTRVRDGHRVALPTGCPKPIYDIIISCCHGDRQSRPPFKNLVSELGLYHRNESVKETTRDVGLLSKSAGK